MAVNKKTVKVSNKKGGNILNDYKKRSEYLGIFNKNYNLLIAENQGRWNNFRVNSRLNDFFHLLKLLILISMNFDYFFNIDNFDKCYKLITEFLIKFNTVFNKFQQKIMTNSDLNSLYSDAYSNLIKYFIWFSNQIFNIFKEQVNIAIRKMFEIDEPERCRNGLGKIFYCNSRNTTKIDPSSKNMYGYSISQTPPTEENIKYIKTLLLLHTQLISFLYGYSLNIKEINNNFADIKKRYTRYIGYLQQQNRSTYESQARNRILFNIRRTIPPNELSSTDILKFNQIY